jgi:hypothetical protein
MFQLILPRVGDVTTIRQFELYANPKKCSFYRQEVEFLGYLANAEGVRMDPKRVESIVEWKIQPPELSEIFKSSWVFATSTAVLSLEFPHRWCEEWLKTWPYGHNRQETHEGLIDCFTTAPSPAITILPHPYD